MINSITKRDGSVVEFDPDKLTHWAKWASVVGVDWFAIAADAYKRCPDNCTTKDLHDAMIQACADHEDTPHMMMAGRLLIGDVYKQAFGGHDKIPTVKEMYKKMVANGSWEDMGYTDEELDIAESFIWHQRDLNSIHSVVHQIATKYSITDIETGKVLESPQFTWMRMALGICKNETKQRMHSVFEHYMDLALGDTNAPTPNIRNLGTPKRNYASCCVFKSGDDSHSLAAGDHIAYTMTCASAGIGGYLETRSKGDGVRNNTIKHGGKFSYLRNTESNVHANLQGGRGGAATMHIKCIDPEIMMLLRLRHPTTPQKSRLGGIDYSFGYHPYLAERAANNENWMLVSFKDAPELYQAMHKGDDSFVTAYQEYEAGKGKRKYVKARKLALEFLRMQEETGRMYEHNTYEMNRHTPFKDTIWSSNLCVAPETLVLTDKGHVQIASLDGQEVLVWNGGEWSDVTVRKTSNDSELIKVSLSDGKELECTRQHKFYKAVGYSGRTVEVAAEGLAIGDKLTKLETPVVDGAEALSKPYENGFYSGDGCKVGDRARVYLYGEKQKLRHLFSDTCEESVQEGRTYFYVGGLREKFFVPCAKYTVMSRVKWLEGILDSDGCVFRNGNSQMLEIVSAEVGFLREVQLMLQTLGVQSKVIRHTDAGMRMLPANDGTGEKKEYYCRAANRLLITATGIVKLLSLGLDTKRLVITEHMPNRECSHFVKVSSVEFTGRRSATYCFTEPKRNMGVFNGILTGQCQEIGLPTKEFGNVTELYDTKSDGEIGLCNLAAVKAGVILTDKIKDVAYRTLKMVDNVIEIMDYPFPHLAHTAKARRSVGIGITDLAHDLALKGLHYDTPEGKAYLHRMAEAHSFWLHVASVQLAKERGACEWFSKTKYADGWLPIDTYHKGVDEVTEQPLLCDWEWLRGEIAKYGMRNSVLEAFMPVESSSVAGNTTNALYPVRDLSVTKKNGTNKAVFLAPDMEELEDSYQPAWVIRRRAMIDVYAIFQKFCGQAISADMYRAFELGKPKRISARELLEDWFYRIKRGLKTVYYSNTRAGHEVEQQEEEDDCVACKL